MSDVHTLNRICDLVNAILERHPNPSQTLRELSVLVMPIYRELDDQQQTVFASGIARVFKKSGYFRHQDLSQIRPMVGLVLAIAAQPANITTVDFESLSRQRSLTQKTAEISRKREFRVRIGGAPAQALQRFGSDLRERRMA